MPSRRAARRRSCRASACPCSRRRRTPCRRSRRLPSRSSRQAGARPAWRAPVAGSTRTMSSSCEDAVPPPKTYDKAADRNRGRVVPRRRQPADHACAASACDEDRVGRLCRLRSSLRAAGRARRGNAATDGSWSGAGSEPVTCSTRRVGARRRAVRAEGRLATVVAAVPVAVVPDVPRRSHAPATPAARIATRTGNRDELRRRRLGLRAGFTLHA